MCINTDNLTKAGKILLPILIFIWLLPFLILIAFGLLFPNENSRPYNLKEFSAQLFDYPLPPQTELLDQLSIKDRLHGGNGEFDNYAAVIVVRSQLSQEQLTEYYREAMNPTEGESDPPEDGPSVFLLDVSPAESSEYQPSYNEQYPFHFKSLDSLVDFQGIYYISIFS